MPPSTRPRSVTTSTRRAALRGRCSARRCALPCTQTIRGVVSKAKPLAVGVVMPSPPGSLGCLGRRCRLAQLGLHDLAHRVAGELGDDVDALRHLVVREPRAAPLDDLRGRRRRHVARWHDEGGHGLAEVGMRHGHDSRLAHCLELVDGGLDLRRVDVVAAADDQVLRAPGDRDVAVGAEGSEVARPEEAVGRELGARRLGQIPVPVEQARAADLDHPGGAGRQRMVCVIGDPQVDLGERSAHRAGAPLAIERVGAEDHRLGGAVAFDDLVSRPRRERALHGRRERCRAAGEEPHGAAALGRQALIAEQAVVVRRDAHEDRRPRERIDHLAGVEARQELQARAGGQGDVRRDEQAVAVEQRQRVKEHVRRPESPRPSQRERAGRHRAVAQHRALRPAGGTRRVEQRRDVVGAPRHDGRGLTSGRREVLQRACSVLVEAENGGRWHRAVEQVDRLGRIGAPDEDPRPPVGDQVGEFGRTIRRVRRQVHEAGADAGEVERERVR